MCVCVRESVSDLYSRERAYDTDEKLAEESDREREREMMTVKKRSRKPDQTWAQVTRRGYPVSIATGRCETLGANLAFDLLRQSICMHMVA